MMWKNGHTLGLHLEVPPPCSMWKDQQLVLFVPSVKGPHYGALASLDLVMQTRMASGS